MNKESDFLRMLFDRAVEAADPMRCLPRHLPQRPDGRVLVVGAGKASARMAEAVEASWGPCEGLVITRYGYARPCVGIEVVEAAHPVPDRAGLDATVRMLDLLENLGEGDFVLALISGGASSLLVAPVPGISLAEKSAFNASLLASGAPISVMNTLRKRLSRIKGGRLAAAAFPAQMLSLIISDVPGDDPGLIGSGPTVGVVTSPADVSHMLDHWRIHPPSHVRELLVSSSPGVAGDDLRLSRVENHIIAAPAQSIEAAAKIARKAGYEVRLLGDNLEGESRDVATSQASLALALQGSMKPGDRPILILSGGELTVTRRGDGIGGPNAEFCLALAIALNDAPGITAIACDTDGVDGIAEVAGAVVEAHTIASAIALGIDPKIALQRNDAHSFFAAIGGQIITGPTFTNVNDFRAILIASRA